LENNLESLRSRGELTQSALAKKAGTSQQQIQRIEAGKGELSLDLAIRIASALEVGLSEVFPAAASIDRTRILSQLRRAQPGPKAESSKNVKSMTWITPVLFAFDDGTEFIAGVDESQIAHLEERIWADPKAKGFALFTSQKFVVAVNVDRLGYWTIEHEDSGLDCSFDSAEGHEIGGDEEAEESPVLVQCASRQEPFRIWADIEAAENETSTVQDALMALDDAFDGDTFIRIMDQDRQSHYFRRENVLVFSVSKSILPDWE